MKKLTKKTLVSLGVLVLLSVLAVLMNSSSVLALIGLGQIVSAGFMEYYSIKSIVKGNKAFGIVMTIISSFICFLFLIAFMIGFLLGLMAFI